jgi:hypothetical protein
MNLQFAEEYYNKLSFKTSKELIEIISNWKFIINDIWHEYCSPSRIVLENGGILFIKVQTHRALELLDKGDYIINCINVYYNKNLISKVVMLNDNNF